MTFVRDILVTLPFLFLALSSPNAFAWQQTDKENVDNSSSYALTAQEKQWLASHKQFTIGIDKHWYPYEFIDERGEYSGITADHLDFVSELLDAKFEIVETENWNEAHRLFKQGRIDILPAMIATEERKKNTLFTVGYFSTPTVIVSRKNAFYATSISSLEDRKLALVKGFAIVEYVQTQFPQIEILFVDSIQQGLESVNNGDADAYIGAISGINSALNNSDFSQLIISAFTPFDLEVSMAISDSVQPLVPILNKVFASMSNRQKASIANTWLSVHVKQGLSLKTVLTWGGSPFILLVLIVVIIFRLNRSLKKEIKIRRKAEEKLKRLAQHDPLTNLPNRRMFEELAHFSLAKAQREKEKHALLFIDIDGFKEVNDEFGHQIGDELLKAIANRLQENVRASDIVARMGGDEFLILLNNDACRDFSTTTAQKIINALSKPFQLSEANSQIGASIGIAIFPEDGEDLHALIKLADKAMYKAKSAGKNQFIFSTDFNC